ncbi:MAG: MBL fold metallo-hydrolase [Promethearchaeia archaeon]
MMISVRFLGNACVEIISDDDHIIIDPNYLVAPRKGINKVLITHEHDDHIDPEKLVEIRNKYIRENQDLEIYGSKSVAEKLDMGIEVVEHGAKIQLEDGDIKVFKNNCWKAEDCLAFLVLLAGREILHTADSASYSDELRKVQQDIDCCFVACFEDYFVDYFEFLRKISPKLAIPYHYGKGDDDMAKNLINFVKENDKINIRYLEIGGEFEL